MRISKIQFLKYFKLFKNLNEEKVSNFSLEFLNCSKNLDFNSLDP